MIFQHTYEKVLNGTKTETRRLVKSGEYMLWHKHTVYTLSGRIKWQVGNTYAIQPGRGQKAVGYIIIQHIYRQHVQDIMDSQARAEGVADRAEFEALWRTIHAKSGTRWEDNPEVWVIEFKLVRYRNSMQ